MLLCSREPYGREYEKDLAIVDSSRDSACSARSLVILGAEGTGTERRLGTQYLNHLAESTETLCTSRLSACWPIHTAPSSKEPLGTWCNQSEARIATCTITLKADRLSGLAQVRRPSAHPSRLLCAITS